MVVNAETIVDKGDAYLEELNFILKKARKERIKIEKINSSMEGIWDKYLGVLQTRVSFLAESYKGQYTEGEEREKHEFSCFFNRENEEAKRFLVYIFKKGELISSMIKKVLENGWYYSIEHLSAEEDNILQNIRNKKHKKTIEDEKRRLQTWNDLVDNELSWILKFDKWKEDISKNKSKELVYFDVLWNQKIDENRKNTNLELMKKRAKELGSLWGEKCGLTGKISFLNYFGSKSYVEKCQREVNEKIENWKQRLEGSVGGSSVLKPKDNSILKPNGDKDDSNWNILGIVVVTLTLLLLIAVVIFFYFYFKKKEE